MILSIVAQLLTLFHTKSKQPRAVPMNARVRQLITARLETTGPSPTAKLFSIAHPFRAWNSLRKTAGMATFRFHDLRHTAISHMAAAGVPQSVIMAIAGHVESNVNNLYTHPYQPQVRQAVEHLPGGSPAPHPPRKPDSAKEGEPDAWTEIPI